MAGPWEKYGAQAIQPEEERGPWTKYGAPQVAHPQRLTQRPAQTATRATDPAQTNDAFDYDPLSREYIEDDGIPVNPDLTTQMAQPYGDGSSRESAIDLSGSLYADQVGALKQGSWVRTADGETYQLPGDAFFERPRSSDEQQSSGLYVRRPNAADKIAGMATAFTEQVPFGDEAVAGVMGAVTGRGYDDVREQQMLNRKLLNQTNRGDRDIGGLAGFTTGFLLPGGALANRGSLFGRAARGAGVGAGYGALYGAGAADDGGLAERAKGGAVGGLAGAGLGAAIPLGGRALSGAGDLIIRRAGGALNYVTGGRFEGLNNAFGPDAAARRILSEAAARDGVSHQQARQVANEFLDSGVTPSLIDVLQRAAPGGEAARLIRGAAMQQGPASVAAERYAQTVAGNLQDRAIGLTRELTPDQRSAVDVLEALTRQRSTLADTQYAAPYAERITPPAELVSALSGDPGMAAMRRARTAAVARRNDDQVADIDQLMAVTRVISENPALAGRLPMPEISAGTLDRVRIAMQGRGEKLRQSPDTRDIASGVFGRAADLDTVLDGVPGLRAARDNFRGLSQQIDAVEEGARGLNAPPNSFIFDDATRPSAGVGYRDAIENAIGRPSDGSTGILNRLATSSNQTRNLREVFGDGAGRYQEGIGNLVDQLNNARFLASSSGSQTAPLLADQALVEVGNVVSRPDQGLMFVLEKVRRGASLTRAEREALVRLGVTNAQVEAIRNARPFSGQLVAPMAAGAGSLPER